VAEPPAVRASDAERERAVTALREHCAAGRLTLEEFTERVEEAYKARTREEVEQAFRELPPEGALPKPRRQPKRLTFAAFGRVVRRGRWRVARRTLALSVFGDLDLDLRQAEVEHAVVTVRVLALFGNVDVYVPEGVESDVGGFVLFGHRREWGRDDPGPGAPVIRVSVLTLFGTADVWRVPAGTTGNYSDVIKAVRQQQRELTS